MWWNRKQVKCKLAFLYASRLVSEAEHIKPSRCLPSLDVAPCRRQSTAGHSSVPAAVQGLQKLGRRNAYCWSDYNVLSCRTKRWRFKYDSLSALNLISNSHPYLRQTAVAVNVGLGRKERDQVQIPILTPDPPRQLYTVILDLAYSADLHGQKRRTMHTSFKFMEEKLDWGGIRQYQKYRPSFTAHGETAFLQLGKQKAPWTLGFKLVEADLLPLCRRACNAGSSEFLTFNIRQLAASQDKSFHLITSWVFFIKLRLSTQDG